MRPLLKIKHGIRFWHSPLFESIGCRACFFLRSGGVSKGSYKSLNLGLNTTDLLENILINRHRIYSNTEFGPYLPIVGQQIHHNHIAIVNAHQSGRGWFSVNNAIPKTDGLITSTKGLPLAVTIADCVPILLADENRRCIAAVHAGWRGIEKKIISKAIQKMIQVKKIPPKAIRIIIGPSIGPNHFEITNDTYQKLNKHNSNAVIKSLNSNQIFFNLQKAAFYQIIAEGILPEKVHCIDQCTFKHANRYFSYRRDGIESGRMMAMIQLVI